MIASFLRVVDHPKVSVSPGGMIPVVVKAVEYALTRSSFWSLVERSGPELTNVWSDAHSYLDATNEHLGGGQSIPRPRYREGLR